MNERIPILYLAPWVGYGGSDKNTIDWFRWIDRDRFAPSLIVTQPSPNPLIDKIAPYAEEIWVLPDLMGAEDMPEFIFDFLHSRSVRVLHLMNSRLGFELLPDLACLPNPPAIVVQLHVEEADRSGYVRYVTTRYGNLVDRFSTSNRHVADAVEGYGIPAEKIRVIYTGADPDDEFSPDRAVPIEDLPDDRLQILFAARLVAQKDPLLMLDVAAALRDRDVKFQLHVVGEGEMEDEMRERIATEGLDEDVLLHPPTPGLQGWYAACDALLMTSAFEGIPCVVFEAMAMGLPIVAPDLPAIGELLGDADGALVSPRDSVEAYVSALARLAEDRAHADAQGAQMRARARDQFTVQQMAASHGELYDELIEATAAPLSGGNLAITTNPIRFTSRPLVGTPLVSVLVPHFNQARFLGECIESVRAQTYPEIELIVIDDGSTQQDAQALLDLLDAADDVTVVKLSENGGPSRTRNAGLERSNGRYILPVDADNVLLPDAIEKLVGQLSTAGEEVGFIYPNLQFFGNREDYYEVPQYNLYTLLHGNFCDTCSLLDREIFEAGERYSEAIHLGHEDWEFALRLAARGVRGEAARGPTVRYRKWGFNRSDMVDHSPEVFHEILAEISPFKGVEGEIKAKESPALSIVALKPVDLGTKDGQSVATKLEAQRCLDAELIARFEGNWPAAHDFPPVRQIPASLARTPFDAMRQGLEGARGAFAAVCTGDAAALLADPTFSAKVLQRFAVAPKLGAIVLADAGSEGRVFFQPLDEEDLGNLMPHTVIWRRTGEQYLPKGLRTDPATPLPSLISLLSGAGNKVEWRHAKDGGSDTIDGQSGGYWARLPAGSAATTDPNGLHPGAQPLLPGAGEYTVPRWEDNPTWIPAISKLAIRYKERHGERRLVTSGPEPVGFVVEHHMGALRSTGLEGTTRVVREGDQYRAVPRGEWQELPPRAEEIGYAELAHLPGMDVLALAVHRVTRQPLLVTLPEDPILDQVDVVETLGCLDPFPLKPRQAPSAQRPDGLRGLVKAIDHRRRRHAYAVGALPDGEMVGELGALAESDVQGSIPVWIVEGCLLTDRHRPPPARSFSAAAAARWVAEPAAWRGLASRRTQAKAALGRATTATRRLTRPAAPALTPTGDPVGWLFDIERPGMTPLFAAYHPVTDDQLLSRRSDEAAQLGYVAPALLGYLRLLAPLTGETEQRHGPIPWARRFGAVPRSW